MPPAADTAAGEATLEAVVAALAATPGVRSAEPLDRQAMSALLEPWLGDALLGGDLPLPRLVAVKIGTAAPPAIAALQARLEPLGSSAERRVGKQCVSNCRSRRAPYHLKQKHKIKA